MTAKRKLPLNPQISTKVELNSNIYFLERIIPKNWFLSDALFQNEPNSFSDLLRDHVRLVSRIPPAKYPDISE